MTHFLKYHGLGNDFVLLDRLGGGSPVTPAQAVALCDRRRGVGADGVLTVLPPASAGALARMHVTNADGSVAEMCGNGLRCVARYLIECGRAAAAAFVVDTDAGPRACSVARGGAGGLGDIAVEMGAPAFATRQLPRSPQGRFVAGAIAVEGDVLRGTAVSMGNPHLVLFEVDRDRAADLGPRLERHPLFPERTNVEFVRIDAGPRLDVVVWERGCGFTQACGTGACAAAVAAVVEGRAPEGAELAVHLAGGELHVRVEPGLAGVTMRGPAVRVFEGDFPLE